MQLIIDLPSREETLAMLRQRWQQAVEDPRWSQIEGKFESNSFGQIIVTPPPAMPHNSRAFEVAFQLRSLLGGHGMTECPVLTIDGVKVPDATWFSRDRYGQVRGQVACEVAPEICVEVLSPSNTPAEMTHKRHLYFEAGAEECWVCDAEGRMTYYFKDSPDSPQTQSKLCPKFPETITD